MSRGYERVYNELLFDRYYRNVPELRTALCSIDRFVSTEDEQVQSLVTRFKDVPIDSFFNGKVLCSDYIIAEMANWRRCKQVYDFDIRLYDELVVTPEDKIPTDLLSKIPYPVLYIRCPHDEILTEVPPGIQLTTDWSYQEQVHTDGAQVIYVDGLLDIRFFSTSRTTYTNVVTGKEVVEESNGIYQWGNSYKVGDYDTVGDLLAGELEGSAFAFGVGREDKPVLRAYVSSPNTLCKSLWDANGETGDIMHVLGALIYLVSKEADATTCYVPSHKVKRRGNEPKLSGATVTKVGYRIGRELGAARKACDTDQRVVPDDSIHGHMSPHIRRAHWHCYWVGPRHAPTDIVVHWLAPILVNAGQGDQTVTVHRANQGR